MKFISTENLCNIYDVEKHFFLRRKESGEYQKNIHYVQQGNTLRWDIEKIKEWWYGDTLPHNRKDVILNKILP